MHAVKVKISRPILEIKYRIKYAPVRILHKFEKNFKLLKVFVIL